MQRRGELWLTQLGEFVSKNIKQRSLLLNKNTVDVLARGCGKRKFVRSLSYVDVSGGGKVCGSTSGPSLVRHRGGMVLWAAILILQGAGLVGSMTGVPGVPENITVMFLNPTSVRVSWSTSQVDQVEKYDVTYKPTDARNFTIDRNETIDAYDAKYNETYNETFTLSYNEPYNETYDDESYRMVRLVAGNSDAVTLTDLQADTQYQLVITAVRAGKKYRSRPIVFRTLEPPRTSPQHDATVTGGPIPPPPPSSSQQPHAYIQVRGVEVGIVVMVLIVWAGAIALFFNRWGKIRMLLPYQPDYKEQLKVPGTGACTATTTTCTQHSSQHACSQHLHWSNHRVDSLDSATGGGGSGTGGINVGGLGWPRSSRPRINSAIDVAGFLSQEFLRRHGSTSRLCRKVRSADNLPLASCSNHQDDDQKISNDEGVELERDIFSQVNNDEDDRIDDVELKRQSSLESSGIKDNAEISLLESSPQQSLSRECTSNANTNANSSLVTKRLGGWRVGGSHEYVKCPIRQSSVIDERFHRHSCEPDFTRPRHHHRRMSPVGHLFHYQSMENERPKNHDYSRRTMGTSVETQHFGLPILSISEPSPPDERDRLDDYL